MARQTSGKCPTCRIVWQWTTRTRLRDAHCERCDTALEQTCAALVKRLPIQVGTPTDKRIENDARARVQAETYFQSCTAYSVLGLLTGDLEQTAFWASQARAAAEREARHQRRRA